MASLGDTQESADLTELTPVSFVNRDGEETEAKVPISVCVKQEIPDNYGDICAGEDDDLLDEQPEHLLYRRFQTIYRSLPKEMFISRIIKNVSSSEPDLESQRAMLFELVKECEDFPYGLQAELKRRVHTRNGDTVAVKLAQDIYILMSVLEGNDFTDLKVMIASGRRARRSLSQSQSQSGLGNVTLTSIDYAAEIKSLEINMNNMKADVLGLKQQYVASEATRSSQLQTLKSTVFSLKADLSSLTSTVTKAVTDISLAAQRIESEKSLGVHSVKTELRLLKASVRDLQDTLDNMTHGPPRDNAAASKSKKLSKKAKTSDEIRSVTETVADTPGLIDVGSSVITEQGGDSLRDSNTCHNNPDQNTHSAQIHVLTGTETDGIQAGSNTNNFNADSGERYVAVPAPPSAHGMLDIDPGLDLGHAQSSDYGITGTGDGGAAGGVGSTDVRPESSDNADGSERMFSSHEPRSRLNAYSTNERESHFPPCIERQLISYSSAAGTSLSGHSHPYAGNVAPISGTPNISSTQGAQIPVHTAATASTCSSPSELEAFLRSGNYMRDADEEFAQYVRRKPKRYYLGGFLSSITHDKISRYVKKRGPTTSFISIWKSKRNLNNAVIRLNLEDDGLADMVLSPSFWPRGVTCRPWLGRNDRNKDRHTLSSDIVNNDRTERPIFGRSDIDDYNPFSPLRDQANCVD